MTELTQRRSKDALLAELRAAGADVRGANSIRCPFHEDRRPSSGVYETDGVWRFKCHGCGFVGDLYDVRAKATGKSLESVLADASSASTPKVVRKPPRRYASLEAVVAAQRETVEAVYRYTNPDTGHVDLFVIRMTTDTGKTFRQGHQDGRGYVLKAPGGLLPLYNRTRLKTASTAVVVEGEKCVHELHAVGVVATTSAGGAGKADKTDWSPLAGKAVVLWPDDDKPGRDHMRGVLAQLEKLTPRPEIRMVDPESCNLPEKGDAADLLAEVADLDHARLLVQTIIESASEVRPGDEFSTFIENMIAGKYEPVPLPFRSLDRSCEALRPGSVVVVCGLPGAGKSFFVLQCLMHWLFKDNISCSIFELEESRQDHMLRALAMMAGDLSIAEQRKAKHHSEKIRAARAKFARELARLEKAIEAVPDTDTVGYDNILAWADQRMVSGDRVVIIDPITAAQPSREPWIADHKFVMDIKRLSVRHGASTLLVSHPPKNGPQKKVSPDNGLDYLAGGAAFGRFTQTVFVLVKRHPPVEAVIMKPFGRVSKNIDRSIFAAKVRHGWGQGHEFGFLWDVNTGLFIEEGLVVEKP